ncbi:MAG: FAD:protein FMN transferase [Sedimentisphaerales bacterium]
MSKTNRRIAAAIIGVSLVAVLYLFVSERRLVEVDSGHRLVMGTFARVVAIAADSGTANRCIEAALAEIQKVDELMSDYKSDSEISRVNRDAFRRAVKVSQSTYQVLQRSVEIGKLTDGAFDITVGPLVDLFRAAEKKDVAPSEEEIALAKLKVGFEKLKLDSQNRTVKFAVEGMRLDLGGIAKGYAVDKAIEAMKKAGAIGAMVDIGGDIRCAGRAAGGKSHWLIGLQDPKAVQDSKFPAQGQSGCDYLLTLKLVNGAVATSGDYQQFVLIEGKRYSHIINRRTGKSAEGLSSVTIIADNATDADALATAVSVMGAEKGLALIGKLPDTEAILITSRPEYELTKTSGAEKFIK